MIAKNKYFALFLVLPLLSLKGGDNPQEQKLTILKQTNDKDKKEVEIMLEDIAKLDSLNKTNTDAKTKLVEYTVGSGSSNNSNPRDTLQQKPKEKDSSGK